MLITFDSIVRRYRDPAVRGILHVGAHEAEEHRDYKVQGVTEVIWVEADPAKAEFVKKKTRQPCLVAVVSDQDGDEITFHTANNGQSSSIFELGSHKHMHPEVHYVSEETRTTSTLKTLLEPFDLTKVNFLNMDIQGAELKALEGLGDDLKYFDYIYAEVNREELYVGCAQIGQIDEFLTDFTRKETEWTQFGWGDALYVRKQ